MIAQAFDPLAAFFGWWMNGGSKSGCPPSVHDGITRVGDYTGLILYRQPPFQVELWILPPNMQSTEHSHPNVDIFLVHVTGDLKVWVGDKLVLGPVDTVPDKNGVTKSNGNFVRIAPGELHKAETGPLGGAFMNVQLWTDGKPRSTDSDWKGDALNEDHKKKLVGYVKSLNENSDSCTKEPESTSKKVRSPAEETLHSLAGSTATSLITDGLNCSVPGAESCGQVSQQAPVK